VNFAGFQIVFAGGTANATTLNAFGDQEVLPTGTAINTIIHQNGDQIVFSGGTTTAPTIDGGDLFLEAGAIVTGPIIFTGTGGRLFDSTASPPVNVINGFAPGDLIDLEAINFDPNGSVQLQAGNVLQFTQNGVAFHLNFDPAQNFTGEFFHVVN